MGRKKPVRYTADFETTTELDDCRVWGIGLCNIDNFDEYHEYNNLDDFFKFIEKNNGAYYFHNLKFDGSFIIDYLLKNGFEYSEKMKPKTFNSVISEMGAWYTIKITYDVKGKNSKTTTIYDSLKKLPFPVKKIAKDFNLPIQKGDIDYKLYRPVDHVITKEESSYLRNDVEIMARALKIQFDEGQTKMTIGSDALNSFKTMLGGNANFKKYFPVLESHIDNFIRKSYKGGFTWVNPLIQGKTLKNGMVFDVNSLYPSIMYNNLLPYGVPVYFKGKYQQDDTYPLFIQNVKVEFSIKENMIPTIQIKGSKFFKGNEYLNTTDGEVVNLHLTNQDLELLLEHYDIHYIEYVGGFKFMGVKGIFKKYIDTWGEIKKTSQGAIKQLAKLMLNNLYGKFATNPDVTKKIPVLSSDGVVRYVTGEQETKEPVYTAMGSFITAGARYKTIKTAQSVYDRICYCDTDSIHITGTEPPNIEIDDNELGYWQHESNFIRARFLRQKTYIEDTITKNVNGKIVVGNHNDYDNVKLNVVCAGMPDTVKEKINFDNFHIGFKSDGKLMPKRVSGGTVLVDSTFTIK